MVLIVLVALGLGLGAWAAWFRQPAVLSSTGGRVARGAAVRRRSPAG